jgi:hypothetical protein
LHASARPGYQPARLSSFSDGELDLLRALPLFSALCVAFDASLLRDPHTKLGAIAVRRVGDPRGNKHSSGWSAMAQVLVSHGRKYVRHLSSEPVRLTGRSAPCQCAAVATDVRRIYAGPAVLGAEMHRRVLRRPSRMCSQTRSRCGRRRSRISRRSTATRSSELVLSSRRTAACAPSSPWCTRPRCSTPSRYPDPLPTKFRALSYRATACPCNPRAQ